MSLRLRLTLLYSTLVGVILLVFGSAVFLLVNILLLNQIDETLASVARDIIQVTRVDSVGELSYVALPPLDMTANAQVQVWNREGKLRTSSPGIEWMTDSLDPAGLAAGRTVYHDATVRTVHWRVLSVPLKIGERMIGVLQVGTSLAVADSTRRDLANIMLGSALVSVLLAALLSWTLLGRALSPLSAITDAVDQINRADDLSRRIPQRMHTNDEISDLVESFNQTLERLEALFTSQQRFLADVSHELRTPLTVIKGNVDLMRRMNHLDEESLSTIDQEAGRLTRLVGGLLLLAQAECGKLSLNMKPVELDTLLLEVFHEMRVLAGGKVKMRMGDIDQAMVKGDRDRLKQVLLNLVGNAIQYTPSGGEVITSLAKIGDQVRIIVRDTGPGIPQEDLPFIFERFYRAEKSRTRGTSTGFGLGLSIAQWIVENHGGTVEVESREGQGTTFAVWLPLLAGQSKDKAREKVGQKNRE